MIFAKPVTSKLLGVPRRYQLQYLQHGTPVRPQLDPPSWGRFFSHINRCVFRF
jgi:hypothetical protein